MNKPIFLLNTVASLALLICAVPCLSAQTAPSNGIAVHTLVTVEARHGSSPPVINREDVMVTEGKDRDTVTEWVPAQGDHAALEFFLLIDDSSNVTLGTQLNDLQKFINGQPATAKIGVAYMQNGMARIVQNLTSDHELAAKSLRLPLGRDSGEASPYFSLSDLIKRWPASSARREVLMVSNGIDLYYGQPDLLDPYLDAAIHDAQRAGILVSAIYTPAAGHAGHSYWLNYWGQLYLAQVAERTGGESYYIGLMGAPVTFVPYLNDVTQRLNHQYLLTFLAKPPKKSGFQRVRIRTEVSDADLVGPKEVWVPAD
ncbi:MAG: hypothetical protein ACLQLC_18525 [Candidatus Sulfotelmatobacter sp.]